MKHKLLFILFLLILVFGVSFVFSKRLPRAFVSNKLQVTTSFYPLYFFTSEIGGTLTDVHNITPAGVEPHDYEPSLQDIVQIQNSQLLVLNGDLEPWDVKVKIDLKDKQTQVLEVGSSLVNQILVENDKKIYDPHIWLSPVIAKQIVLKISNKLIETDNGNSKVYTINTQKLLKELDRLDQKFQLGLKNCDRRDFITSHAAFGYLASTYNLQQVSIAGLSPGAEPSLQQLAQISDYAKTNNIKYIFFESLVSPKLTNTLSRETGAKTLILNPLEGLTEQELLSGKSYITEMENNLINLRIALACQ